MGPSVFVSALSVPLLWGVLPSAITNILLQVLYSSQVLSKPTNPAQAKLYNRRMRNFVCVGYLLYTTYASLFRRSPNFYEILGVDIDSDIEMIRKSFRRLARIYHPDKIGAGQKSESFFVELRLAHDTLVEPVRRQMYNRIGDRITDWNSATISQRDTFIMAAEGSIWTYVMLYVFCRLTSWWLGREPFLNPWHLAMSGLFLSIELSLMFLPERQTSFLSVILPSQTIHNIVNSLRVLHGALIMAYNEFSSHLPRPKQRQGRELMGGSDYERSRDQMRADMEKLKTLLEVHERHSRELAAQAVRSLDISLLPLRPARKIDTQAGDDGSETASTEKQQEQEKASEAEPSQVEQTYVDVLEKLILRSRLESIPGVDANGRGNNAQPQIETNSE